MDRANDGVSSMSRRGGGGGAETKLSQRRRVVLSISKNEHAHPISRNEGNSRSHQKQSALSSCDAMRCHVEGAGRFLWWFPVGPAAWLGVCWRWSQPAVLAPNARTGSWLQRPCWPPGPLGPGILPCSFFQPPTTLCRPMPIPPSAFRPFSPSFRSTRPSNVTPFSTTTTRPPHTDTTLCKFLHPCHYQLCTYATQTAIRSTINLISTAHRLRRH